MTSIITELVWPQRQRPCLEFSKLLLPSSHELPTASITSFLNCFSSINWLCSLASVLQLQHGMSFNCTWVCFGVKAEEASAECSPRSRALPRAQPGALGTQAPVGDTAALQMALFQSWPSPLTGNIAASSKAWLCPTEHAPNSPTVL